MHNFVIDTIRGWVNHPNCPLLSENCRYVDSYCAYPGIQCITQQSNLIKTLSTGWWTPHKQLRSVGGFSRYHISSIISLHHRDKVTILYGFKLTVWAQVVLHLRHVYLIHVISSSTKANKGTIYHDDAVSYSMRQNCDESDLISHKLLRATGLCNPLCPGNTIWRHKSGSALASVMACCLTTPNRSVNQGWLFTYKVLWLSRKTNYTGSALDINS